MASDRDKYVMSTELAMQREMAYRKKLETSRFKQGTTATVKCLSSPNQRSLPGASSTPRPPSFSQPRLRPNSSPGQTQSRPLFGPKPQSMKGPNPLLAQSLGLPPKPFSSPSRPPTGPRSMATLSSYQSGSYQVNPTLGPRPSSRPISLSPSARPTLGLTPRPRLPFSSPWRQVVRPRPTITLPRQSDRFRPNPTPKPVVRNPCPKLPPLSPAQGPISLSRPILSIKPSEKPSIRPTPSPNHKRKEAPNEQLEPNVSGKTRKLICKVCEVECTSESNLQMHLMGQKHKSKANGVGKIQVGDPQLHCDVCGIWCMNEFCFKQHVIGKNHIKKLHHV